MNNPVHILRSGLEELGLAADNGVIGKFSLYMELLKKWSKAYNLTSITDYAGIITKHFLDSCLYLSALPGDAKSIADIGSGAGFPGLAIKIVRPDLLVYLIEPSWKKAAFLRHAVSELSVSDVHVLEMKVEDTSGVCVDAAMTRALFKAGEFASKASGVVRAGGLLIMNKGKRADDELEGISCEVRKIRLPNTDITRNIVIIKNTDGC